MTCYLLDRGAVPRSSTNLESECRLMDGIFSIDKKVKQPPASSGCFVWSFEFVVYFWLLYNFFIQKLPL